MVRKVAFPLIVVTSITSCNLPHYSDSIPNMFTPVITLSKTEISSGQSIDVTAAANSNMTWYQDHTINFDYFAVVCVLPGIMKLTSDTYRDIYNQCTKNELPAGVSLTSDMPRIYTKTFVVKTPGFSNKYIYTGKATFNNPGLYSFFLVHYYYEFPIVSEISKEAVLEVK